MSEWKKVKIGDICKIVKGTTGIASAEPGQYPLVVTAEERKTCSTYQFDCEAECIPLVSSSGHGKKSLKNVHYQSGKFALGTILCAVIPNNLQELDARYLHQYLQFYKDIILVPLMKGAANVSLSMKDIATVEFPLPPIERQRELSNLFVSLQENQKELSAEYEKQTEYAKLLRQNILQQAIEGKLTSDWRKQNPVQKGNPDYDAEALFEQIQKERSNEKKQKQLSPITDEEKPFKIPDGWKWVRLGEIINLLSGRDFEPSEYNDKQKGTPYITGASNFGENGIIIDRWTENPKCIAKFGDLLLVCKGSGYETLTYADFKEAHIARQVMSITTVSEFISLKHIEFILRANFQYLKTQGKGLIPGIDRETVLNICAGLPSVLEQGEIVTIVEKHLQTVSTLESQITEREQLAKQLMQSILKDAFEER
ncbi:MAG: restriction endonuclease subunit S [Treponema sp.]|nr:restriction endonuclease subunit S [Treponema sp.]